MRPLGQRVVTRRMCVGGGPRVCQHKRANVHAEAAAVDPIVRAHMQRASIRCLSIDAGSIVSGSLAVPGFSGRRFQVRTPGTPAKDGVSPPMLLRPRPAVAKSTRQQCVGQADLAVNDPQGVQDSPLALSRPHVAERRGTMLVPVWPRRARAGIPRERVLRSYPCWCVHRRSGR